MENLTNEEKDYYELLADMLDDGIIDDSERNILNKRKEKYGISEGRAKEIEDFARQEYLKSKTPQFETDGERDYYELLVDMLEDGYISDSGRNILNKRKEKYKISDDRAKELENLAIKNNNINLENSNNITASDEGKTHYWNRDYDKAIKTFLKAVRINPNNDRNWYWISYLYKMYEQYDKAIEAILKAVEIKPNRNDYWFSLVYLYHNNGQYEDAIVFLLEVAELLNTDDKEDIYWYEYELGRSYYLNEEYEEAINSFLKVLEIAPDSEYIWYLLADAYLNLEDYNNAIDCYERAININEYDARYWNNYGVSLERVNRLEDAKNCYKRAVELEPNEKLYSNNFNKVKVGKIIKGISNLFK